MEPNPYSAPAQQQPHYGQAQQGYSIEQGHGVSPRMVDLFNRTRGWALFIGILAIIGSCFMILGALGVIFAGSMMASNAGPGLPAGMVLILGLFYGFGGGIGIFLGVKCIKYSGAIRALSFNHSTASAEEALDHQRVVWKTVGILGIIWLCLFIVMMGVSMFSTSSIRY